MIPIKNHTTVLTVKHAKTQFYRFAGFGKPLEECIYRGDKVTVLEKRWEWIYAIHINDKGKLLQGWLRHLAFDD